MRYTLAVLTHGESASLGTSLASFWENVSPWPSEKVCVRDGDGPLPPFGADFADDGRPWHGYVLQPQAGFCVATRALWDVAYREGAEYVFWLEHDFVFRRPVDLRELADVLDDFPAVAQMALMRNAVNKQEKAAGGLYEFHQAQGRYVEREGWLAHEICFTTNPSLIRAEFMRQNPWPGYESECEGKFSGDLLDKGYVFGHWGSGEIYVEHVGERSGFGY